MPYKVLPGCKIMTPVEKFDRGSFDLGDSNRSSISVGVPILDFDGFSKAVNGLKPRPFENNAV